MYRILTSGYPKRRFGLPWMFCVIFGVVWCSWQQINNTSLQLLRSTATRSKCPHDSIVRCCNACQARFGSCRKSLGISPALMRLFPNLFLWYFSTTKQYLFILICTGRYDVPFSWNKIGANMAAMAKICNPVSRERIHFFKWKLEWYFAVLYAI